MSFTLFCLVALLLPGAAQRAGAQAYTATNTWSGAGGDAFWATAGNWSGSVVPLPTSLGVLTNTGSTGLPGTNGSGAVGTPNVIVTNDTRIASLAIMNTNFSGAGAGFHTIQISNGVTLTISNNPTAPQVNVLQVCSQSGAGAPSNIGTDYGVNTVIFGTIQGEGGTLAVVATNNLGTTFARGNIFVGQGSLGLSAAPTIDPLNAVLDLSGLDNFRADVNRITMGDGGLAPFFFNRPAGTIYLAKTNRLVLWAVGAHGSFSQVNQGILGGVVVQNNGGGLRRTSRMFLGQTNEIYCTTGIALGVRGCSAWMGFNPSNAPGSSTVFFRDRAGAGRQTLWAIGHRLNAASVETISGELDFSLGTVDAMVGTLGVAVSPVGNTTIGTVSFGAGTIDVNTLQVGFQSGASGGAVQGTLNVSNTALLKVNTSGILGGMSGSPLAGTYFGRINITDGGEVQFANTAALTCGVGNSSEIKVLNGSKLKVFTAGSATAPLTSLQLADSTLSVDRGILSNPSTAPVVVETLEATGTNTIDVLGSVVVAGTFPLIKYTTLNGDFTNFVLGATSPGVTAALSHNVANSTIDVTILTSITKVLFWDGQTNGVDVGSWDMGITTNWQGGVAYSQLIVPGSLVRFNDTAAGTTSVTFTNEDLAPAEIIVTNAAKDYRFSGSGALIGTAAFIKSGTGTLLLDNAGTNSFAGGMALQNGTLRLGSANRLPTTATVTFANDTATLDLNNFDQTLNAISGGGAAGGTVALGTGLLTIRAGGGNFAGTITGSGALVKNTAGTQTLSGDNTYSGGTVISNSTLLVINSSGSGLGTGPINIATNGTLQIGNGTIDGAVATAVITNNGTLSLNPANSMTLTQLVVGGGNFLKLIGSGSTLDITNANLFTGNSAVQQGVLQIAHPNALGTGTITVGNATATDTYLALAGDITVTNTIVLSGKTGAIVPSPVGINNASGTNTLAGLISVVGSTCWSAGSDGGKLVVTGPFTNASSAALGQFFLRGSGDGVWMSNLRDGSASLRMTVDKNDGGTWTLTGTNTYTGRTRINLNGGTLVVDGALAGSSNVLVFAGGALAGSGYISGAVTNSGTIIPALDGTIGTLRISNVLFLDVSGTATFDVSTNGNDSIRGLSRVVYGGTLNVNLAGPLTGNCVFKLFDAALYNGAFDAFALPDISPLTWDTSQLAVDGTLRAVGAPVIAPAITSITLGAGAISISGTGTVVAPFGILASTNVALPLASWVNIGGGAFSNGQFVFTDAGVTNFPQRFYRLVTPSPYP